MTSPTKDSWEQNDKLHKEREETVEISYDDFLLHYKTFIGEKVKKLSLVDVNVNDYTESNLVNSQTVSKAVEIIFENFNSLDFLSLGNAVFDDFNTFNLLKDVKHLVLTRLRWDIKGESIYEAVGTIDNLKPVGSWECEDLSVLGFWRCRNGEKKTFLTTVVACMKKLKTFKVTDDLLYYSYNKNFLSAMTELKNINGYRLQTDMGEKVLQKDVFCAFAFDVNNVDDDHSKLFANPPSIEDYYVNNLYIYPTNHIFAQVKNVHFDITQKPCCCQLQNRPTLKNVSKVLDNFLEHSKSSLESLKIVKKDLNKLDDEENLPNLFKQLARFDNVKKILIRQIDPTSALESRFEDKSEEFLEYKKNNF